MLLQNFSVEQLIANAIALLVGLSVHEFAHAWVADAMGDPTPRSQGRLTLNPLVSINWPGFLMFVILGFGMLASTPISASRMWYPRFGAVAALLAGPISNFGIAAAAAIIFKALGPDAPGIVQTILWTMMTLNVILFLFNLLPLYPLDGWRIVEVLLPRGPAQWWSNNWLPSYYLFFGLILFSLVPPGSGIPNVLGIVIGQPAAALVLALLR